MAEEQSEAKEATIHTGDDLTCPNCGSHNVGWIPYPKWVLGPWFFLWLVIAFGGYLISPYIMLAGIVFWSIALIVRMRQNYRARLYNRMHCDICGTEFDVDKRTIQKGGGRI